MILGKVIERNQCGAAGGIAGSDLHDDRSLSDSLEPVHALRELDFGFREDPAVAYLLGEHADRPPDHKGTREGATFERDVEPLRVRVVSERLNHVHESPPARESSTGTGQGGTRSRPGWHG